MIEELVPACVAVACTRGDVLDAPLLGDEALVVERAVPKRRDEFTTGRACARKALAQLGLDAVAIPSGERGEPIWPAGVAGSLTHCRGFRGCAVARDTDVRSLGIDAEPHEPLPDGVLEQIAFGRERALVGAGGAVHADRVLFCAKEAIYKAWFPLARRWLGFEDVELAIDFGARTFSGRLLVPGPVVDGRALTGFRGRWLVADGIVCTAVVVLPDGTPDVGRPGGAG